MQFSICDVSIFGDYVSGNTLHDGNLSCSNSPELDVCDGDVILIDEEFENSDVPDPEDDPDEANEDPDPEEDPDVEDEENEDPVTDPEEEKSDERVDSEPE